MKIYPESLWREITECHECPLGSAYSSSYRARNLVRLTKYAPTGRIVTIILGESPPYSGGYIYDSKTPCGSDHFSYQVFADLGLITRPSIKISSDDKESFIKKMGDELETIVLDCCHCCVNQMRDPSRQEEKENLVAYCFERHASKAIDRILGENDPRIWFKLPVGHSNGLFDHLKGRYGSRVIRKNYWHWPRRVA